MSITALIAWLVTALVGFSLLATWLRGGGVRQQQTRTTGFPAPVIFGHFLLAVAGLVVWIIYVMADTAALAWTAFGILLPVVLLGFTMLVRWIPLYRARSPIGESAPAERRFPVSVVAGHGLFAVVTLVLVLLTALGEA